MENSFAEKDLEILMNSKLRMSQKCTLAMKKVNFILGCIKKSVDSKPGEVISLLHSAFLQLHLVPCVQFWPS